MAASFADIPAFDPKKQEETKTKLLQERLARKEEADARKEEDDEKNRAEFCIACEEFTSQVTEIVKNTIEYMTEKGKTFATLDKSPYEAKYGKYSGHLLHYGFHKKTSRYHTKRDPDTWTNMRCEQPFKKMQRELAKKGYYLYDISDPGESFQIKWILQTEKLQTKPLWHQLNVI